jgi:hypothetical protein
LDYARQPLTQGFRYSLARIARPTYEYFHGQLPSRGCKDVIPVEPRRQPPDEHGPSGSGSPLTRLAQTLIGMFAPVDDTAPWMPGRLLDWSVVSGTKDNVGAIRENQISSALTCGGPAFQVSC